MINEQRRRSFKNKAENNLTFEQWKFAIKYFGNRCAYCGEEKYLTQDHFIPLSKYGGYTANNIIPVCASCNSSKNNREFSEWYEKQNFKSKSIKEKVIKFVTMTLDDRIKMYK